MSYTPKCNNCEHSLIQYTLQDGFVDMHFDKPLLCAIHNHEVDDDGICEVWKIDSSNGCDEGIESE